MKRTPIRGAEDCCVLMVKIPFVYCQVNMEDLSVTGCLHTFVTERVCFLNNSGEEKINSFIVVISSLNFLIEEQISSTNVFKGAENVAIVDWSLKCHRKFYFTSYGPLQN